MRVAPDADGKVRHHRKLSERIIPVHSLRLRVGALIEFEEGQHRGMWGRVTAMLEGQSVVRLNLNGTVRTRVRCRGMFTVPLLPASPPPPPPALSLTHMRYSCGQAQCSAALGPVHTPTQSPHTVALACAPDVAVAG
jgi:hypothetical protein